MCCPRVRRVANHGVSAQTTGARVRGGLPSRVATSGTGGCAWPSSGCTSARICRMTFRLVGAPLSLVSSCCAVRVCSRIVFPSSSSGLCPRGTALAACSGGSLRGLPHCSLRRGACICRFLSLLCVPRGRLQLLPVREGTRDWACASSSACDSADWGRVDLAVGLVLEYSALCCRVACFDVRSR